MSATITKGYTFGATEQVTNEKLHNLVDDATISEIVNGDVNASAAIVDTKISFGGTKVCELSGTQTVGGNKTFTGEVEFDNNVTFADQTVADLGTVKTGIITSADINGGTIDGVQLGASSDIDIDGGTLDGVQIAGATAHGELFYNDGSNNVAKLANGTSGQYLKSNGIAAPSWAAINPGLEFVSKTAVSAATTSGNIAITAGNIYKVICVMEETGSGQSALIMRFNGDSGASYADVNGNGVSFLAIGTIPDSGTLNSEFIITPWQNSNNKVTVIGETVQTGATAGTTLARTSVSGLWVKATPEAPTYFTIANNGGAATTDMDIYLYKYQLS